MFYLNITTYYVKVSIRCYIWTKYEVGREMKHLTVTGVLQIIFCIKENTGQTGAYLTYSRIAGHRFLLICLNSWHTAKLYIFGKSRMWLIEISMSSLSSVVTLWDNFGQRSNPYFSKKNYQTLAISFLRTFFVIFIQKKRRSAWEIIKVYNPI